MGEPTTISEIYKLLSKQNEDQTAALTGHIRNSEQSLRSVIRQANLKLKKLETSNIYIERKIRANNILLFGPKDKNQETSPSTLIRETISKPNELFSTDIMTSDINNIYKLGKGETAPTLIEFVSYLKKAELFRDTEKLKNLRKAGYGIANDLCESDRNELKVLKEHLKKAREEGKEARIKGQKLEINKKLYTARELEDSSEYSSSDSSETDDDVEEEQQTEKRELQPTRDKLNTIRSTSNPENTNKRKQKTPTPEKRRTRAHKKKRC